MKIGKWLIGASLAITVFGISAATRADSFSLDTANFSGYTGPYQTVGVTLNTSTTATITFHGLTQGGYTYFFSGVAVNVNATSWTVSNILASNVLTGTPSIGYAVGGSGNMDGFGSFNQKISPDGSQGSSNPVEDISFDLKNNSGTWAGVSDVLTGNNPSSLTADYVAAAHTLVFSYTAPSTYTAINVTGFTTGTGNFNENPTVPLPSGAWGTLVLLGILGLGRKFVLPRAA